MKREFLKTTNKNDNMVHSGSTRPWMRKIKKTLIINSALILLLAGTFSASAKVNESDKRPFEKRGSSERSYLLNNAKEQPVNKERRMKNTEYFLNLLLRDIYEDEIKIEEWMYDPGYFNYVQDNSSSSQ